MKTKYKIKLGIITLLATSAVVFAAPPKQTPALIEKGKASYTTNCSVCHGEKGDGNGPAGAAMNPKPRNLATEKFKKGEKAENIFSAISSGLPNTSMAGFGHLGEEERWGLTYYVLSFRKGNKK